MHTYSKLKLHSFFHATSLRVPCEAVDICDICHFSAVYLILYDRVSTLGLCKSVGQDGGIPWWHYKHTQIQQPCYFKQHCYFSCFKNKKKKAACTRFRTAKYQKPTTLIQFHNRTDFTATTKSKKHPAQQQSQSSLMTWTHSLSTSQTVSRSPAWCAPQSSHTPVLFPTNACMWLIIVIPHMLFVGEIRDSVQWCNLVCGKMEDSPGPDPAPEPELLPSDLSSDWPTGREGGMVNMKIQGMESEERWGSNDKSHTRGLVSRKTIK